MQKKTSNSVLKWPKTAVAQLGTGRPPGPHVGVGHRNPELGNFLKFRYLMAFDGILKDLKLKKNIDSRSRKLGEQQQL